MGPLPRPPRRCQRGLKIASYTPSFPNPRQQYSTPRCPAHCITSFGSSPTTFAQSSFTCPALLTSASPSMNRTASTVHAVRASRIPRPPTPTSGRKASISFNLPRHAPSSSQSTQPSGSAISSFSPISSTTSYRNRLNSLSYSPRFNPLLTRPTFFHDLPSSANSSASMSSSFSFRLPCPISRRNSTSV